MKIDNVKRANEVIQTNRRVIANDIAETLGISFGHRHCKSSENTLSILNFVPLLLTDKHKKRLLQASNRKPFRFYFENKGNAIFNKIVIGDETTRVSIRYFVIFMYSCL